MLIPESKNNIVVYDALECLKDYCSKDLEKIPATLLDIMMDKGNTAQDRIQAAGMLTYIATFSSVNNSMFQDPPFKIQLIGKGSK